MDAITGSVDGQGAETGSAGTDVLFNDGLDSNFGSADTSTEGQPTDQQNTPPSDPHLTPENLSAFRASLTQKSQEISQREQQITAQQQDIARQQREFQSAQVALEHPAVRASMLSALQQNAPQVADNFIARGLAQPHERQALIAELSQNPAALQQPQQNPYQPQPQYPQQMQQMNPQAITQQVMQQVQQQMKAQETERQIDASIGDFKTQFTRDTGREATQEETDSFLRFAYSMGQNPLQHAYKVMNYDKLMANTEMAARQRIMKEMQGGADPYTGGMLSESDPEAQRISDSILNA